MTKSAAATPAVAEGAQAPDFQYRTTEGEQHRLSETWRERPALVLWLRHFG